jgi:membrane protease YdiL (CAAX protease family)
MKMESRSEPASDLTFDPPPHAAQITRRERLFLLVLVTISTVSMVPLARLSMSVLHPRHEALEFETVVRSDQLHGLLGDFIREHSRRIAGSRFVIEAPPPQPRPSHQFWALLLFAILAIAITYTLSIVGLRVAKRAHLNAMPLLGPDAGDLRKRLRALLPAIGFGLLCLVTSILIVTPQRVSGLKPPAGTNPRLLQQHKNLIDDLKHLAGWQLLVFGVFGGPIAEELECRLLLVSLLAWVFGRLWRIGDPSRSPQAMWTSAIVSGLTFGLLHILGGESVAWWRPIYAQLFLDPRTYDGIVLAWLYWNRGIESSIVAHVTVNVFATIPWGLSRLLQGGRVGR